MSHYMTALAMSNRDEASDKDRVVLVGGLPNQAGQCFPA